MYYVKMVMECYEIYYILYHFRTYYIGVLYFQMDMEKLRGLTTSSFFLHTRNKNTHYNEDESI